MDGFEELGIFGVTKLYTADVHRVGSVDEWLGMGK
jgi:hypothetical protein